jgi:tRNA(Ile)-lysidine synthase
LALLSATVFEARREPWRVVGVTVDHGLQEGSDERADAVVEQMAELGADETATIRVTVDAPGMGVEAAAREARYAALTELAERRGCFLVLVGHTSDDQAETVLLGLTRGSGGRSIAGMRRAFSEGHVRFERPLLDVTRAQTEAACRAEGITWWNDPHNDDPRFTRSRIRHRVMPVLEEELGPGVAAALARTADQLQEDIAALDERAELVKKEVTREDGGIEAAALETEPSAVFSRVLRRLAVEAGSPPSELVSVHVAALVDLMYGEPGRQVQLPGHVTAYLEKGWVLRFRPT